MTKTKKKPEKGHTDTHKNNMKLISNIRLYNTILVV